jgi:signal transduction histidine kinase
VEDYLRDVQVREDASPGQSAFDRAAESLQELVQINVQQALTEETRVHEIDRFSRRLGFIIAIALVVGVGAVLIWLVKYAFKPVFPIRDAMWRFARGDRSARAPEAGPTEFRIIASQFNELADVLTRHRETQLASLASVAHDLRNPLSALNVSASLLASESIPNDRRRELLDLIKRQIAYLDRLVGDLLDASRAEAGRLELRIEKSDLKQLVEETALLVQGVSPNHRIDLDAPKGSVILDCDPVRIRQVLNNMITNAIKYSPWGGEVRIGLERQHDRAVLTISDRGIGIPENELGRIFEPFSRSHRSQQNIPGIGLGLYVARRIVEAHGGRIEVESAVNRGTTFRVSLPLEAELRKAS